MMAKKKQGQVRHTKKTKAATIPNLYWRSMTMEQLRQEERCIALAPVDHINMQLGYQSQRYVRQDTHLWSVLHDGMLTTGRLKAALGMHESAAAAVIGIHPGSRGSSHMLAAYSHLVTTTYSRTSTSSTPNAAGGVSSSSDGSRSRAAGVTAVPPNSSSAAASKLQGQVVVPQQQFGGLLPRPVMLQPQATPVQKQQQKPPLQQQYGGLLPRPVMLQVPAQQYSTQPQPAQQQPQLQERPQQQRQQQQQQEAEVVRLEASRRAYNQQLARQALAAASPAAGPAGEISPADVEQAVSSAAVQAARQHSERAAAGGDMHVKMSWGKTQEAAALYCVMQLFPDSLLEEVGLFELDPSQLPASWNTQPGLLPPLGASPDAALVHKLTLLPEDLQAAAALLARKSSSSDEQAASSTSSSCGVLDSAFAAEAAEAAAVQLLLQRGYDRLVCAGKRPAPNGVQYADSSDESVPSSSHGSSEAELSDGASDGGHGAAAAASSDKQPSQMVADTASVGASTAVGVRNGVNGSAVPAGSSSGGLSADQAGSLAFEPVAVSLLRVLQDWQQQQQQSGMLEQPVTVVVREAVEVKNHCPFGVRYARSGKKGRTELAYKLSPRGCAGRVHPQWIPQLQLHMAATGCQSVLLASRCAAQGMRVYRVWRDDAYLRDMLMLLQELQACHVLRQVPPRPDSLSRLAAHKPFLNRTVALARGAECIAAVGENFVGSVPSNAVNQPQFWQPL